jgi:hypothetical protein
VSRKPSAVSRRLCLRARPWDSKYGKCPSFPQFDENRHGETFALHHLDETTARLLRPVNRHRQSVYSDCVAAQAQAQAVVREPYTVDRRP